MDFSGLFADGGREERFSVTKPIDLNGVVSYSACQNVANGTQDWKGIFAKQKDGPVLVVST